MQEVKRTLGLGKERTSEIARVIMGIVLLILVTGIWACLWVPPSPIF